MKAYRIGVFFLGAVSVTAVRPASAEFRTEFRRPTYHHVLVQAELDYLPAVERAITLEVTEEKPAAVLQKIRKLSGLAIEVQGLLPNRPVLSASYQDTETRVILEWLAAELDLAFRAEPPNKLWIIVDERGKRTTDKDAS
jgi:hypothetical protein